MNRILPKICALLAAALLPLSACSPATRDETLQSSVPQQEQINGQVNNVDEPDPHSISKETYESILGTHTKLQGIWLAGNHLFFVSDGSLYKMDVDGSESQIYNVDEDAFAYSLKEIENGYALLTFSSDTLSCAVLDEEGNVQIEAIAAEGDVCSSIDASAADVSKDGTKIAYCSMGELYLYDMQDKIVTTLYTVPFDYWDTLTEQPALNGIDQVVFAGNSDQIYFSGSYATSQMQETTKICGVMSLDGTYTLFPLTAVSEEKFGSSLLLPCGTGLLYTEDFRQTDGQILYLSIPNHQQTAVRLSTISEGNFVYPVANGHYLISIDGNYQVDSGAYCIRIYAFDGTSASLLNEHSIALGEAATPPTLLFQENSHLCTAVFGADTSEANTQIESWSF